MSTPSIGAHELRSKFLGFFKDKGHEVVRSAPLVPQNDPTLLFVNAGMVQFKDVFTGRETRPYSRATSTQKCLRAGGKHNDLDNVGFTPRHHTLFEMLGNFSFGDYFKQDAINWGWQFLTEVLGIPASRLCVSVYNGEGEKAPYDQEAFDMWAEIVPRDRIFACDAKENFWAMGDTGPCGPCSEIHLFRAGDAPPDAGKPGKGPAHEDDKYLELWNLVFMQYEKRDDGELVALPKPSIDTGAGLERLAATMAGVESNYETELLKPLVDLTKSLAGVSGPQSEEAPFQVVADHARAAAFLIADGVFPDRGKREYVLRRIMRRAIRYGTKVGLDAPFFDKVCMEVVERFGDVFPELRGARATIEEVVKTEEASFRRTLSKGLRRLDVAMSDLPEAAEEFPVGVAAELYDTYGFPIDLTGLIAKEKGLELDEDGAAEVVKERQAGGGETFKGQGEAVANVYFELQESMNNEFLGYGDESGSGKLLAILRKDGEGTSRVEAASAGDEVELVFDRTPFYAESGGQVGDAGVASGQGVEIDVADVVKPAGGLHVHRGTVKVGSVEVGDTLRLEVNHGRRASIRRNHSATHLLHHALREVLGEHVIQKGSLVAEDRLRFDFSHGKPLSQAELQAIERHVNEEVLRNAESSTREMGLDAAKEAGAIGLFGEKYGETVRVVSIGHDSVELCGGTHVSRAGDVGLFAVTSEGGIAQGVRRIEAVTGSAAVAHVQHMSRVVHEATSRLHAASPDDVIDRLEKLQDELKAKAREVTDLQRKLATGGGGAGDEILEIDGVKLLAKAVPAGDPKALREAADTLRDRLKSGVVVLAGERDGKASMLVAVTKDLKGKVHAGKLVAALAPHVDGKGGGRPDLAQAGGPNASGIPAALEAAKGALEGQLRGS